MKLQGYAVPMMLILISINSCRSRQESSKMLDEVPTRGTAAAADFEGRLEDFAGSAIGKYQGTLKDSALFFPKTLSVQIELQQKRAVEADEPEFHMTFKVGDQYSCTGRALLSIDNDAYPVKGRNSGTIEINKPYARGGDECPFSIVLALPEQVPQASTEAVVAITAKNDLRRKIFSGSLSRGQR
jgi:hypothetical protein